MRDFPLAHEGNLRQKSGTSVFSASFDTRKSTICVGMTGGNSNKRQKEDKARNGGAD
jgi:hypothetical protein